MPSGTCLVEYILLLGCRLGTFVVPFVRLVTDTRGIVEDSEPEKDLNRACDVNTSTQARYEHVSAQNRFPVPGSFIEDLDSESHKLRPACNMPLMGCEHVNCHKPVPARNASSRERFNNSP